MTVFPSAVLFLLALGFWGHAESHYGVRTRIAAGIALVASTCLAVLSLSEVARTYDAHRSAMRLSGQMLSRGQTQRVAQAIQEYNAVATTDSTYRAAVTMWKSLNEHSEK